MRRTANYLPPTFNERVIERALITTRTDPQRLPTVLASHYRKYSPPFLLPTERPVLILRRAVYAIAFLLLSATAHAQIEIVPPAEPIEVGEPVALEVTGLLDRARATVIVEPKATTTVIGPILMGGKHYICLQAATPGQHLLALTVLTEGQPCVGSIIAFDVGGSPPPPPPPPPPDDLATQTAEWLQDVPEEARDAEIENPMTGEKRTRQQNVGATYTAISQVAVLLGSVQAMNEMLKNGLGASFGDAAADWQPFADKVAEAIAGITDVVEYGAALGIVGGVLE